MIALRLLILIAAFCGWIFFLNDRLRINPAFTPLVAIGSIVVFVYLGGLMGLLLPAALLVLAAGLLALGYEMVRLALRRWSLWTFITAPGILVFALLCGFMLFQFRGMLVQHPDNFSHWLTIVKEMIVTDAFPLEGTAVHFKNYTPGSAVYIYSVCKLLGYSEGHCLFAQGSIIAASFAPIFAGLRKRNVLSFCALGITMVAMLSVLDMPYASLHLHNLLVDELIAYVAFGAGVIAYLNRKDLFRCLIAVTPVLGMLALIKSSARFVAALLAVLILLMFARQLFGKGALHRRSTYAAWGGMAAMIGLQLLLPEAWNWRVKLVFPEFNGTFASSVGDLVAEQSNGGGFLKVAQEVFAAATDLESINFRILLFAEAFAVVTVVVALLMRRKPGLLGKVFAASNLLYLFYLGEMFFLYAFIFEGVEAETLASFRRYNSTGVLLSALPLVVASIYQWKKLAEGCGKRWCALLLCLISIGGASVGLYIVRDNAAQLWDPYKTPEAVEYRTLRTTYHQEYKTIAPLIPRSANTAVFQNSSNYFVNSLPQIELLSRDAWDLTPISAPETIEKTLARSQYAINFLEYDALCARLAPHGYIVEGESPSKAYTIDHSAKKLIPLS